MNASLDGFDIRSKGFGDRPGIKNPDVFEYRTQGLARQGPLPAFAGVPWTDVQGLLLDFFY